MLSIYKTARTSKLFLGAWFCLLFFSSCGSGTLIISKYSSAESTPFVIGILSLGVLIGLLGYNLFLAITTRETMFVYFSVIMVLLSVLQTFSTYDRFLFRLTYNRVTVITHLLFITFLLFFENFFQAGQHNSSLSFWNKVSIAVIAGYTAIFLGLKLIFPHSEGLHTVINFIRELFVFYTNALFIANIIIAMRWMKKEAIMILIAFIPPALLTSLNAMNIFPFMERYRYFTTVMMQYNQPAGLSLQALLLSLAMGNKYNRINAEKFQADKERDHLKRLDKEKTDFFMNMSHELRTPLTIILGLTKQLDEGRFGDSIRKNSPILEAIERNGVRLLKQANAMLRIEKPGVDDNLPSLQIDTQLKLYMEEFLPVSERKNLVLSYTCEKNTEKTALKIKPEDLDSVVLNLISNAVKYTPRGGSVTITADASYGSGLRITVVDTGGGISDENKDKIFDRFRRFGGTDAVGSGLGLPVVKAIMNSYGGDITLTSSPGKGSSFTLHFPSRMVSRKREGRPVRPNHRDIWMYTAEFPRSASDKTDGSDTRNGNGKAVEPRDSGPLLLVVEDNEDMCMYISSILSPAYRILIAHNGGEALLILEREAVDLVISDVMMPEMDGHTFYREFQARYKGHAIPFIFLTARDSMEEKVKSLESGAVHFITKPFDPRELYACIGTIFSREKELRKAHAAHIRKGVNHILKQLEDNTFHIQPARYDMDRIKMRYRLSERESDVLSLIMKGLSDKEIAYELKLSSSTIANHNRKLYKKIGVGSRVEAIAKLMSN